MTTTALQTIALDQIRAERNVRELNQDDVDALASSIELMGQLVPAIVYPDGDGYVLVAGHKRYAALRQLGRDAIRAEVRDREAEHSERAVENIVRTQLNPYEEAQAVRAMLAGGLTEDGAARALGWPRARVTARVKLLELPDKAQEMVGAGTIALSAVDQLRSIGHVSSELLDAVVDYLADGNEWAAERLASQPGWVLDAALQGRPSNVFAEQLSQVDSHELAALKLGKRTEQLIEEAVGLHKQLDRYSYGSPPFRFTEEDVDQARAAGVLIEFEHSAPVIVDRTLYRELAKAAIARTTEQLREQVAAAAEAKKQARKRTGGEAGGSGRRGPADGEPPDPGAGRAGARGQPRPRRRTAQRPLGGRPGRHGRRSVLRVRAARHRLRPLALHADRRADRPSGGERDPAGDRRVPRRRDQDQEGRHARKAADRLRGSPGSRAADRLAVAVHRMPSRGLCRDVFALPGCG